MKTGGYNPPGGGVWINHWFWQIYFVPFTSLLRAPVSEMTYTESSGTINSTIPLPYLVVVVVVVAAAAPPPPPQQ